MGKDELRMVLNQEVIDGIRAMGNGQQPSTVVTALYYHAINTGFAPFGVKKSEETKKETILD